MDTSISVSGPNPYEVHLGRGLEASIAEHVDAAGAAKVGIVYQPPVSPTARGIGKHLEDLGVCVHFIDVPDGEEAKSLEVVGSMWDRLGREGFSRADALVAVGGGATTDLVGFVAATWMRGIKVIQVPTTLLAMVDAAVGGKTGINTESGKNLVGAFHEPHAVFVDADRLATLPASEIIAGSAEIIKTGFISDPAIIELYQADPRACLDPHGCLPELIERAIRVKATVVGKDLKEAGLREILNYGHTFGHAIELRENYTWAHGNAVAVGMMFEAELAHARGLIGPELVRAHRDIMESVGLPTTYEPGHFDALLEAMKRDKKNRDGHIRFVALTGIGHTIRIEGPDEADLRAAYANISA